ncbi:MULTISPECIES: DUF1289 domain-containing protein [unclassified Xanthobacter]|uniref:DUF1289 domain-containing protein n=1 Tax=unclassified Xanthobacter TaxID=2623496 RepID=UPI001F1AC298|nr:MULTISPECIES: DUF1289 domain-containing protein [unclassified Xanthobacter]
MNMAVDKPRPASPCIGACAMDEASGQCRGCARTRDEIAIWGGTDEATRQRIWAELPARAAAMGLALRRLPWRGSALLDQVEHRFASAQGAFVAGVFGAVAEVLRDPDEPYEAARDGESLTLRSPRAALRLQAPPYLTAFEIPRGANAPLLAFAVPAGRVGLAGPAELTALGPDGDSLLARDAGGARFDIGLARRAARFSIRCGPAIAGEVAARCGAPWPLVLAGIAPLVLGHSPVRVVETPCVRAEVDAPIPPPDGRSPEGPHTHLLPELLAQGLDVPPGLLLPKGYILSLLFHPV